MNERVPAPTEIRLRKKSRTLEVAYPDGARYELPCEYLRVFSPSAEVRGHGPNQAVLVVGKESVGIRAIDPVGHYAVRLTFDDGHDSGLFSWAYLRELGEHRDANWADYLEKTRAAGYQRKEPTGSGSD
jgi:DUF971 family protein